MAEVTILQTEADALLAQEKHRTDESIWTYPAPGEHVQIPLKAAEGREAFILDIQRGRIAIHKRTYQNRAREVVVLARLDLGGAPHQNPDGAIVVSPHVHIYREGYGDKWALPATVDKFPNLENPFEVLWDFMTYCNVTRQPRIQQGLFS